jgi:3-dehydroquinate dehydratase/shikimate dehydrogenase
MAKIYSKGRKRMSHYAKEIDIPPSTSNGLQAIPFGVQGEKKRLCVVIKGPTYAEAHQQLKKAHHVADIAELRLDYFEKLDIQELESLRKIFPIPMIFTLRSKSQGGQYPGEETQRLAQIESLAKLQPEFIDLEYDTPPSFIEQMQKIYPQTQFILSYHDFTHTPDLLNILTKMRQIPTHYYKIATMAQSTLDALRTLDFINHCHSPLFMMNMGEEGQITRILSPLFGSTLTYAALDETQATAPGQLSIDQLLHTFRFRNLKKTTHVYGLIGDPVYKSLSHVTHNAVMQAFDLDAVYVKMKVTPHELQEFFTYAKKLPFRGLSVTMPLKEDVMPYLDQIDPIAKQMGAVNTILFDQGRLIGTNTDGKGALDAIEKQTTVEGKRVIILGAGGAAKAIAYTAHQRGAHVLILNRNLAKAYAVASEIGCEAGGLEQMEIEARKGYDILINCTPLQMPIFPQDIISGSHVMDTNTNPKLSELLKHVLERGCQVTYGYEMFTYQAVAQFEHWFQSRIHAKKVMGIIEREALNILF